MSDLKINMNNLEEIEKSLNSKSLRVCVIGIGRIGLPTALSFAKSGLQTIGVDINENLVRDINSKKFPSRIRGSVASPCFPPKFSILWIRYFFLFLTN